MADGSDDDREVHPRVYPVPGRLDLERAMRAYVQGHDRGWDAERKADLAAGEGGPAKQEPGQEEPTEERSTPSGPAREGGERAGRRYGIPVPETLDFHRGADTWRDRLPRPGRSRRPAGWPGGEPDGGEDRGGE